MEISWWVNSAGRAGGGSEGLEGSGKCLKDAGLDGKEGELPVPANIDEAAGLEFLDVVRERGGGDGQCLASVGESEGTGGARDALKKLETLGIGEGLENGGALGAGKASYCCCAGWR